MHAPLRLDRDRPAGAGAGRVLLLADDALAGGRAPGSPRLAEALRRRARASGYVALEVDAVTGLLPALHAVHRIPLAGRWRWDAVVIALDARHHLAGSGRTARLLADTALLLQAIGPVVLLVGTDARDRDAVDGLLRRAGLTADRFRIVGGASRGGRLLEPDEVCARLLDEVVALPMGGSTLRSGSARRDAAEDRVVLDVALGGAGAAARRLRQAFALAATTFSVPCARLQVAGRSAARTVATIGGAVRTTDTFAAHLHRQPTALIVPDTRASARWRAAPECTGPGAVRFYAGRSCIAGDGRLLLHLFDDAPHAVAADGADQLDDLVALIAGELAHLRRSAA